MNAVFNFRVSINESEVLVNIDVEKTKDVDINFLQQTLKVLNDASKKIKSNAEKYTPGSSEESVEQGVDTADNDAPENSAPVNSPEDNEPTPEISGQDQESLEQE